MSSDGATAYGGKEADLFSLVPGAFTPRDTLAQIAQIVVDAGDGERFEILKYMYILVQRLLSYLLKAGGFPFRFILLSLLVSSNRSGFCLILLGISRHWS